MELTPNTTFHLVFSGSVHHSNNIYVPFNSSRVPHVCTLHTLQEDGREKRKCLVQSFLLNHSGFNRVPEKKGSSHVFKTRCNSFFPRLAHTIEPSCQSIHVIMYIEHIVQFICGNGGAFYTG